MSIAEFVSHLKSLDVRLSAEGQRLRLNAPKGVLTDSLRAQITERKQELLQVLSDDEQSAAFSPPPILQRTSSDPAPLSFAQERLWFLEQLEPGSAVYNICRASRLTGQLNIAALQASLTEIVRRHQILRSQIRVIDGRPMQITASLPEFKLHFTDLRSLTGTVLDGEIRDQVRSEGEWQLDFSAGLFLRAMLLQISDDQHILVLTTHHIVSDAWSMGIFTRELWTLYDAYANGRPPPMQDLPCQYADYAVWQREWLQGEVLETLLSYWREQLENVSLLNLPNDHIRPTKQSFRGARQSISLPQSLTRAVNELSRREGVTQFMLLLAAFYVLLYRYSGQEDLVVGSPIANRNRPEVEGLVGFFVNTLVLRSDFSGNPSFREFLLRVKDVCLGAHAHQDLPFEKLVQELHPERDLSRNPLFQVMFALQNAPRPLPQVSGISFESLEIESSTSSFDLSLFLRERDEKLIGFFEYSTDLFDCLTIERMIGHFQTLLEGSVADPDQPIGTLPLLTAAERHQLLLEWNDTAADYPENSCIHELFEAQVERTPEAIAVQFEGKYLTYRELNARANQLGQYLRAIGVEPEAPVGICVERSLEMVIGLLGILKVGGAFVPLDPAYPKDRLEFMLKDAQVSVLLTQGGLIEDRISKTEDSDARSSILNPRPRIVCLDRAAAVIERQDTENPKSRTSSENLAYVIYTSGSEGQPKGVQVSHRSVVNCLISIGTEVGLAEKDSFLAVTTICFDIAALEIFLPLITGVKLVIAGRDEVRDGNLLSDRLTDCGATVMQATPSGWRVLLDSGWRASEGFKILCGGEDLSRQLADRLLEGRGSLWNLYGPTETTIWSTIAKVEPGESPVPVGRPIANTKIYILDSHLQPVPVGVHGELWIGGDGLARGYLNRPELTAERFVCNPFSDQSDSLIYRTGDRARYRADGNIEFLGRLDNQVKIRGYRVELGEIEATLNQHPTVKDSVVVACEHESRLGKNLVGYVVPREHSVPSVTELRGYLKEKLPEYMIPSSFVVLETLPLTPNGKVDRNTLPPPDGTTPPVTREFVAPRTEIEELIAQTWREVLRIENVGIYDNFFDLGGHSLLATQIVARLQEAFNKDVALRVLFDAPTIVELAQALETIICDGSAPKLPPIIPVPHHGPFPLSLNQEHLWGLDRMIPGNHFFNIPYVYRMSGELNIDALEKALSKIICRHEALRTVFGEIDGQPVQIINSPSAFRLTLTDLCHMAREDLTEKATARILDERVQPFDLANGPLVRARLLRLTERENLLLVTAHHIIADHRSMQVFRRELIVLYRAFCQGKSSPLPELTIQLGDYACWERRLIDDGLFKDQFLYWEKQLPRPVTESTYQASRDNDDEASFQFNHHFIEIKEALLGELRLFAKKENSTLFIVLVTALIATLYVSTGQREIRVGTLVANRRRESEATIGHFVNTVILSANVSPELELKQLLDQIRDVTLRAHANQQFPIEQLMREQESKCGVDRSSLFRVLFSFQRRDFEVANLPGLTLACWDVPDTKTEVESLPAAFDLIFNLKETLTKLTGAVNVRSAAVNGISAPEAVVDFSRILEFMVSEPHALISKLKSIPRAEI